MTEILPLYQLIMLLNIVIINLNQSLPLLGIICL